MSASSIMQRSNTFHNIAQLPKHSKKTTNKNGERINLLWFYQSCHVMFWQDLFVREDVASHIPGVKISSWSRNNLLNYPKPDWTVGIIAVGAEIALGDKWVYQKNSTRNKTQEISIASKALEREWRQRTHPCRIKINCQKPKSKSKCTAAHARSIVACTEAAQNQDRATMLLQFIQRQHIRSSEKSEKRTDTPTSEIKADGHATYPKSKTTDNETTSHAHLPHPSGTKWVSFGYFRFQNACLTTRWATAISPPHSPIQLFHTDSPPPLKVRSFLPQQIS